MLARSIVPSWPQLSLSCHFRDSLCHVVIWFVEYFYFFIFSSNLVLHLESNGITICCSGAIWIYSWSTCCITLFDLSAIDKGATTVPLYKVLMAYLQRSISLYGLDWTFVFSIAALLLWLTVLTFYLISIVYGWVKRLLCSLKKIWSVFLKGIFIWKIIVPFFILNSKLILWIATGLCACSCYLNQHQKPGTLNYNVEYCGLAIDKYCDTLWIGMYALECEMWIICISLLPLLLFPNIIISDDRLVKVCHAHNDRNY